MFNQTECPTKQSVHTAKSSWWIRFGYVVYKRQVFIFLKNAEDIFYKCIKGSQTNPVCQQSRKTLFQFRHIRGNYGIALVLQTKSDPDVINVET